jgi:hypothetical protein
MSANLKAVENQAPSDPTKEYIAGGNLGLYFFGGLPAAADDVGGCLGLQVYEQMRHDPDISAPLLLLKILVLADGVQLQPSVAKPEMPGYEKAKMISDFHTRSIAGMKPGIISLFEEMLDMLVFGNKISEVTLKDGTGIDQGKLPFHSIKPKPYTAVQFVVDKFWNLLGFQPTWATSGDAPKVIPPETFFYTSLHATNNDPRGHSSLRSAYDAYKFKQQLWPTYDRWLKLNAVRQLIAKVKNGKTTEPVTGADGKPAFENGRPKTISRSQAVLNMLVQMSSATAAVVDADDEVKDLETKGTGQQFERAFTIVDKQVTKALLLQELATREGVHQTRASTSSMSDYVDVLVWYLKNRLIDEFRAQPLTMSTLVNFGEWALEYLPGVAMGDSQRKDWAKDGKMLREIGDALTDSQWLQGTDQLGFKRPDEGEVLPPRAKAAAAPTAEPDQRQEA